MARLRRLIEAARRIADPGDSLGQRARRELPEVTGLSVEGVEFALERCLETTPSRGELRLLCDAVVPAPVAHVLLSSNVFAAAYRAIALALVSSLEVRVRPSRREPVMAKLLWEASPGLFQLVDDLAALPGEHVWAYGTERTLDELKAELPAGVVLHACGPGLGVAVIQSRAPSSEERTREVSVAARGLADDVVPFDQRGCLSPRVALFAGAREAAGAFAESLARELAERERRVPRGRLAPDEAADVTRYRDTMTYAGELISAGKGFVSLDRERERLMVPPVGRVMHVVRVDEPDAALRRLAASITCVGWAGPPTLEERVARIVPHARLSSLGRMQQPPFDGPVDRRSPARGLVL
jgi:hypothetical protein